jgi:hypothetical protein
MSKAAELAALIGSQTALSNRNLIINGAMQVSQRGDSTGKTATGYYGPDRHALTLNSLGTWSISQSTDTPSGEGFGNSYKLEATTADASPAAGDYAIFLQKIEGQNLQQLNKGTSSAESVTLSFYVRSSKTGTYICEIFDNDNSRSISKSYTISSADTWERKTITFSGDTTGTLGNDNASSLEMLWYLAAGTTYTSGTLQTSWGTRTAANQAVGQVNMADTANATWFITGIQLEVGEQDTPFEHRSFGDELARCQRYYIEFGSGGASGCFLGSTFAYVSRTIPQMRATPSISVETLTGYIDQYGTTSRNAGSVAVSHTEGHIIIYGNSMSGGSTGNPAFLRKQTYLSAEL